MIGSTRAFNFGRGVAMAFDALQDRVKITGGMKEFIGKTGVVIGKEGRTWRVRLDAPVEIPGVGKVTDDLWESQYLKKIG